MHRQASIYKGSFNLQAIQMDKAKLEHMLMNNIDECFIAKVVSVECDGTVNLDFIKKA